MRGLLLHNLGWKLLALALSIFLWFSLSGQRRERVSERGYVIPLTVVNVPAQMVIASSIPDSVDVRLKGPFTSIRLADPSKMEAVMDLSGGEPGERIYKLSADDINAPEDLEVIGISPNTVRLQLQKLVERRVAIVPRLRPPAPEASVVVEPATAKIAGPENEVSRLSGIATDPISLAGRPADFTTPATLAAEPNIRILEPKGIVSVHVRRKRPE
ncbi:MAG: CdaR family protein [Thermoanaerobaculia bacterium]